MIRRNSAFLALTKKAWRPLGSEDWRLLWLSSVHIPLSIPFPDTTARVEANMLGQDLGSRHLYHRDLAHET
jgi:hypothetical protein